MSYEFKPMTKAEKKELAERVARTCQPCGGFGGHGIHSSIGTDHEFWVICGTCNGTGQRKPA